MTSISDTSLFEKLFARITEDWEGIETEEFLGYVRPKSQEILTLDNLKKMLDEKRQLRVKLGTDATGINLHIGHIVPLMLLRQFQKAGHHIDFIMGDFTAMIGDPSDRADARKALTFDETRKNAEGFYDQVESYLDLKKNIDFHFNSAWLSKINLAEMLGHLQYIPLSSATQRDDFRKRLAAGHSVSLAEVLYGFLMGIDSLHLKSDVELGGIDQLINIQQCRTLMESEGVPAEVGVFVPLIEGTDGSGNKMSKTIGNTINLNATHEEKFGKVMSIPDKLILPWFKAFLDVHEREMKELEEIIANNPLEAKKWLGVLLIALETKSLEDGNKEKENFERKFSKKELTDKDYVVIKANEGEKLLDVLLPHFESKSELRRLFEQQGVRNNENDEVLDPEAEATEMHIRVGKRNFFKIEKA